MPVSGNDPPVLADSRPNVLVVLTDQHVATALSCAGNADLHTPHLDALAARGVRFTNAYCAQPLCTPSRASMITGRTPTQVGVRGNAGSIGTRDQPHQLGRIFASAGYDCGYAGKWHLPELDVPDGVGFSKVHHELEPGLVEACAEFLSADRTAPFLLVASLTEPHGICQWARGQTPPSGHVAEADWREWPDLPANFGLGAYEPELPGLARSLAPHTFPTDGWDEDHWRRYIYAYYRLCERADAQVGALLAALAASGHDQDTLIVFTADHGDQLAAHQWSQKWVLYEESVRVPLIMVEPGGPRGALRDDLVHVGLDLLPTLCAAAGVTPERPLDGLSLLDADRSNAWREHLFVETMWEAPGIQHLTGRCVRDGRYKYICYAWGRHREQLFDLETDPGEIRNLAASGPQLDRLRAMRELLRAESVRVGDRKFASFVPDPAAAPA